MKTNGKKYLAGLLALLMMLSLLLCACDPAGAIDDFMNGLFPSDEKEEVDKDPVPVGSDLLIHFIDVGQADCTLLQWSGGCVLVDAGDLDDDITERMISYIKELGIITIDYFVLTHPHADHIGGAPEVLESFDVKNVIMPDCTASSKIFQRTLDAIEQSDAQVIQAVSGKEYSLNGLVMTVLAPNSASYSNTNEYSVALRVDYGSTALMLTGDAEHKSEAEMLDKYTKHTFKCHLMKAGHHGSSTSNTQEFLDAVSPDIVVISCGEGNSYGHPHVEALERFDAMGAAVYRTDLLGTLVFVSDGNRISLKK